MVDWLYSLPQILILTSSAVAMVVLVLVLPLAVQRIPILAPAEQNNDFILRAQDTLFTITSLLLAFTVVEAQANMREVEVIVSTEASHLDRLDRLLTAYGDEAAASIRPQVVTYATSIMQDEWPAMLRGARSQKTRAALVPLSQRILSLEPGTPRGLRLYDDLLRAFDDVVAARDARLAAVHIALPSAYWMMVGMAVLMLLFVSSVLKRTPLRSVVMSAQMAMVGVTVGFVFIQDQPFKGGNAVTTEDYVHAVELIEAR
jgi:hypothetical protein